MIERAAPNTKKVLVVDFDPDYLKLLAQWLSREGFQVITATDGLSGLEKFKKERPDLVVLEAMLPRLHGFELCSKITTDGEPRTPVIITTNVYKDAAYRTEAMRNFGAAAYFEKPPDRAKFLAQARLSLGLADKPEAGPAPAKGRTTADLLASLESGNGRKAAATPVPPRATAAENAAIDDLLKDALAEFGLKGDRVAAAKPAAAPVPVIPPRPGNRGPTNVREAAERETLLRSIETSAHKTASHQTEPGSPVTDPRPASDGFEKHPRAGVKPPVAKKPGQQPDGGEARPLPVKPVVPATAPVTGTGSVHEVRQAPATAAPETGPPAAAVADEATVPAFGTPTFQEFMAAPRKPFPMKAVAAAAAVVMAGALAFLFLRPGKGGTEVPQVDYQAALQSRAPETEPAAAPAEEPPDETAAAGDNGAAGSVTTDPPVVKKIDQPQYKQTPSAPPSPELKPVVPVRSGQPEIKLAAPVSESGSGAAPSATDAATAVRDQGTGGTGTESQAPPAKTAAPAEGPAGRPAASDPAPATPKAKAGDLVALENVDVQPVTLQTSQAVYPTRAFQAGREGSVTVNALISERGEVLRVVYLRGSTDFGFDKAALAAVEKWKFQAALKDGVPVKVWKPFTINFRKN